MAIEDDDKPRKNPLGLIGDPGRQVLKSELLLQVVGLSRRTFVQLVRDEDVGGR